MNRVRLLPIVIVAASGLLILNATELVASGEKVFASAGTTKPAATEEELPRFARALARHRFVPPTDPVVTGSVPPKKEDAKKDDPKKEAAKPDAAGQRMAEQKPQQTLPPQANAAQANQTQGLPPATTTSSSERAVLERLQERRGAIDGRARELEMREGLLQAAERKLDGRINELKEIENRMDATAKAEQAEVDKQLRTVVIMYETMKPKDAARVFDRLKLDVLVPIATAMKPARMSEILAVMTPESAERLTVALATRGRAEPVAAAAAGGAPPGELPRIDQQQPAQQRPRR
jgi:flagellar motility protein MotE (MotC chaperone)